jgi:polar amino acid transport system substrate-binding protein
VRLAAPPVPLRWEPPAGLPPATYEVEVLRLDAAGEALGAPQTARVPLTYVIWPWTAEAGASGHYRWRVRVVEPTSLAWSAARSFVLYPSNLDRILDSRTLRVGMEMTYHRPFAWYDVAAQELTGFDIDLAAVIAARLGVAWVPLPLAWDDLFAAVESDRVDLVVSAVTITEERARRFAFSRAYFETGQRLTALARVDRDFGPGSPPFVVATQRGTSSAEAAARLPGAELRLFDTLDLAIAALSAREVDALISDEVLSPANRDPSFRFVGERLTTEGYGVMLARGDPAFLARIDAIVADLASTGWLAGQLRKYGLSSGPAP